MKTNSIRAVACIRFVRRVGLLALLLIAGPPYLVVLLFASPAGMCCDDPTDPIHKMCDPLFWWWDSWKACRTSAERQAEQSGLPNNLGIHNYEETKQKLEAKAGLRSSDWF